MRTIIRYGIIITPGFLTASLAFLRISKLVTFSSDWFYIIAGAGITAEGLALLITQNFVEKRPRNLSQKTLNEF